MTKKRKTLRILASIIAAGCVWSAGMNSVWADAISVANQRLYVAFGGAVSKADTSGTVSTTINPFETNSGFIEGVDNAVVNAAGDKITVTIGADEYTYNYTEVKYYVDNPNYDPNVAGSQEKLEKMNKYWVRDGFVVKAITERYHPEALDVTLDLAVKAGSNADYSNVVMGGEHAAAITDVKTANNLTALDEISYIQYAAHSNSSTTNVAGSQQFFVKQGEKYVDVGTTVKMAKNFYVFKTDGSDFNVATQKYKFNGQDVEYAHVYQIEGLGKGVFLTDAYENMSSSTKTSDLAAANIGFYDGTVYGKNNEVLLSGYNTTTKTWSTVWAAEITDPNATIGTMTIDQFNHIQAHHHQEDVKLALADIEHFKAEGINVDANGIAKEGDLSFVNKAEGEFSGLTIKYGGGVGGADAYMEFIAKDSIEADANGNQITESGHGSFKLNTGSVVSAVNPRTINNENYFNTLNINGVDFKVESISNINLAQNNGNLVVNLTTNSGETITSNAINIGDFIINYTGQPGQNGQPGQPGQNGTGNQTTIEQAINNNYTNITNNTTEINDIKDDYVTNIRKDVTNEDIWYVTQNVDGTSGTIEFKDKHITGHKMILEGDSIKSTITNNFDNGYINTVRVGNATINYDGDNNQVGNTQVTNSTIEQAINKNYNKIVNVENNYVSNIVKEGEHTWKVIQGGQETVTIKDTTLVPKIINGLPNGHVPNAQPDNAISYDFDPNTGLPRLYIEFGDTSGNLVQGAVDIGTLMVNSINYEDDENIKVVQNNSNIKISLKPDIKIDNSLTVANTVKINNQGIDMGDTKITKLAPGEISATSTDAINGSQLYQTNQNLDRLGNRMDKVGAGAAALAALHPMDFDPDDKLQFSAGVGNYGGETAAALGAFYRPTEKVMFSMAGTMGNGENMVNAGVTFALDRKNNVSNSRVAMAHEIQDLRDQVAALTALVTQLAGKGNPLLDTVMFPDVPENHWAYDYIDSLQKRGIIEGYPDGNFGGDRSCTRYEYAAMLYRALEKGFPVDSRLLDEFKAELGRIRIDRIKGTDADANKVERVRVNDYEDRDDYGSKLAQVVANAAPSIEEHAA